MTNTDADYEDALSSPAEANQRLRELAIKFNHPIGRYGFMCGEVTQLRNRKNDPNFKELSPVDTELADVLVKTGRYDVALTRVKTLRGCLRIETFVMHPVPSTPRRVQDHVPSTKVWRWRGSPRCGALVLVVWPKPLRLRLLGYSAVDEILQRENGFQAVVHLLGGLERALLVVKLLASLTDTTTDAIRAPPRAKTALGLRLMGLPRTDSKTICVAFLGCLTRADSLGRLVFRALAQHGWRQVGHAVVTLFNRCADQDPNVPGLVQLVLQLVGLDGTKWVRDARRAQNQAYFFEYVKMMYRRALYIVVNLLRLEAYVTTYKGEAPKTWLSTVLGVDHVAFLVGLYRTPSVLDYVVLDIAHDAFYSPVNIAAPAIMQFNTAATCPASFIDGAITWLTNSPYRATVRGLASFLHILVTKNCLDKMDALWSQVGAVIPAILHLVSTTDQSSETLIAFDRAVGFSVAGFVPFISDDEDNLKPLATALEERNCIIDVQRRLMVNAAAYLTRNPRQPRTLPRNTVSSLLGLCNSPAAAWVITPLVFGLPHGIEQHQLAQRCLDNLQRVPEDDSVFYSLRQDVRKLRNLRDSNRG
ncbi:hypothetical protein SDRG_12784 [Saprolegnia diclina VS20]|uniref:Uncharacterized protein n=1 Tax=Saprolegnia diclina (strain VS20) TaxID=1156394 RepID=T0PVL6_SAPDV|nr:hypothetical protein SDRG_12784 [Saprolegnia diclina VS20]EQC29534.1 hypothetical protein SDRG_12784 [Saprolegnia diclina VS20]|eukprot:XP_008617086.1 hypothetical protein SDRG_12784 [Saprolegnia diclina VS20]